MRVAHFPLLVAVFGATLVASCSDAAPGVEEASTAAATNGTGEARSGNPEERLGELARWLSPPPSMDEYGPYQIELGNGTFGYLQQIATPADASSLLLPGMGGRVLTYSLFVDETQAIELFGLLVPDSPANEERPLLTAFHGFSTSHRDIDARTSFFEEADSRDWYLIAPLQRSLADPTGFNFDVHFSSAQSQLHVQAVMDFVIDNYSIDMDRLYAVGFSMGGGGAMSFAARHRDRRSGAFAAVVNHTGTVALRNVYTNLLFGSPVIDILELIFGGKPEVYPFVWNRSSLIEVDANNVVIPDGRHMALNLAHVPTQTWYNASDEEAHLVEQCIQLDAYFQTLPGGSHELFGVPSSTAPGCGTRQHCWGTLDQAMACDWLGQQTLNSTPQQGSILADRSARWEYFDLVQTETEAFSQISYEIDVAGSSMTLSGTENLAVVTTTLGRLGIDPSSPLKLGLTGFDGTSTLMVFNNVPLPPQMVVREGVLLVEDCSGVTSTMSSWCYDPVAETLTISEVENAVASWRISF